MNQANDPKPGSKPDISLTVGHNGSKYIELILNIDTSNQVSGKSPALYLDPDYVIVCSGDVNVILV
jgi:hypothetical protein